MSRNTNSQTTEYNSLVFDERICILLRGYMKFGIMRECAVGTF